MKPQRSGAARRHLVWALIATQITGAAINILGMTAHRLFERSDVPSLPYQPRIFVLGALVLPGIVASYITGLRFAIAKNSAQRPEFLRRAVLFGHQVQISGRLAWATIVGIVVGCLLDGLLTLASFLWFRTHPGLGPGTSSLIVVVIVLLAAIVLVHVESRILQALGRRWVDPSWLRDLDRTDPCPSLYDRDLDAA